MKLTKLLPFFCMLMFFANPLIAEIRTAQKQLNEMGYHAGPADGLWGNKTENAVKLFLSDNNLKWDGAFDQNEIKFIEEIFITKSMATGDVKSTDIIFPGNFYTSKLKSCSAINSNISFSNLQVNTAIDGLIKFDWHRYHHSNNSSMNVMHMPITRPMGNFMVATHNAITDNDKRNIVIAIDYLIEIARTKTLLNSIGRKEVHEKPNCGDTWGTDKACWYHEYEFARQTLTNYMITALWLRDKLTAEQLTTVNSYIESIYNKFIQQDEYYDESGIYAFANGGISHLIYATWSNNEKLAVKEFNHRLAEFDKHIFEDGYIDNNSFRGVKGQWYHSYGVNIILGYIYIAELWGVSIPLELKQKIIKSAKLVNLAITDEKQFYSREYPYGVAPGQLPKNDPLNLFGPAYTHPAAISIDTLMSVVTGIELEHDPTYLSKRNNDLSSGGIDSLIGFNANCIKGNEPGL